MLKEKLRITQAALKDASFLAKANIEASGGLSEVLFNRSKQAVFPLIMERVFNPEATIYYKNTLAVYDQDNNIIASVALYNTRKHRLPKPNYWISSQAIAHLRPMFEVELPQGVMLQSLYVDKKWQHQGIADYLLQEVHAYAYRHHYASINLQVWENNKPAMRLYSKWGYQIIERTALKPSPAFKYPGDLLTLHYPF